MPLPLMGVHPDPLHGRSVIVLNIPHARHHFPVREEEPASEVFFFFLRRPARPFPSPSDQRLLGGNLHTKLVKVKADLLLARDGKGTCPFLERERIRLGLWRVHNAPASAGANHEGFLSHFSGRINYLRHQEMPERAWDLAAAKLTTR